MKTVTSPLQTHLASRTTTLARIWKLTRTDGAIYGFTSHNRAIPYAGVTYSAIEGQTPTAIDTSSGLSVDNLEIQGFVADSVTKEELAAGKWDFCDVRVMLISWASPSDGVIRLRRGNLGNVRNNRAAFTAELHGMALALGQRIGRSYGPGCEWDVGQTITARGGCGVDMAPFSYSLTVTSVISRHLFAAGGVSPTFADDFLALGSVEWITGSNAGRKYEVKSSTGDQIETHLAAALEIQVGDTLTAKRGCNKARDGDCLNVYDNVVNFGGFPDVPGQDSLAVFGKLGT